MNYNEGAIIAYKQNGLLLTNFALVTYDQRHNYDAIMALRLNYQVDDKEFLIKDSDLIAVSCDTIINIFKGAVILGRRELFKKMYSKVRVSSNKEISKFILSQKSKKTSNENNLQKREKISTSKYNFRSRNKNYLFSKEHPKKAFIQDHKFLRTSTTNLRGNFLQIGLESSKHDFDLSFLKENICKSQRLNENFKEIVENTVFDSFFSENSKCVTIKKCNSMSLEVSNHKKDLIENELDIEIYKVLDCKEYFLINVLGKIFVIMQNREKVEKFLQEKNICFRSEQKLVGFQDVIELINLYCMDQKIAENTKI